MFKKIKDTSFELEKVNILVGSNNSGKSSIIQGIQFAVASAQSVEFSGARWKKNKFATSLAPEEFLYAPIKDVRLLYNGSALKSSLAKKGSLKDAIQVRFDGPTTDGRCEHCTVSIYKGKIKNLSVAVEGESLGVKIASTIQPFSIYVPGLAGIPTDEKYMTSLVIRKSAAKGDANNVLRNILLQLSKEQNDWDSFNRDLKSLFPNIELAVSFDEKKDEFIQANVYVSGLYLSLDSLGTGVLQAIQILSYINYFKPKILLLDEPDSHVHPANQKRMALKLWELAKEKDLNIILTTHSRHLLSALEGKAQVLWIKDGEAIKEHFEYDILMDIGALETEYLFNSKKVKLFVLTEDKVEDVKKTKDFLNVIIQANGFKEEEIVLFSYEGCSNFHTARVIKKFIQKQIPGIKILIHQDLDFYDPDDVLKNKEQFMKDEITYLTTPGYDIESYFLNKKHILKLYPSLEPNILDRIFEEAIVESKATSLDKLEDFLLNKKNELYKRGKETDLSKIKTDARAKYADNPLKFSYSKKVRGLLNNKIQSTIGGSVNIVQISDALVIQELQLLKDEMMAENQNAETLPN